MYKLPVFATIRETYRFIGGQLSALVNYAMVPVVLATVFSTLVFFSTFTQAGEQINLLGIDLDPEQISNLPQINELLPTGVLIIFSFIFAIANFAFYILFAVAWHRRYLLGSEVTSPREIFSWRGRHWRFLGNMLLIALVGGAAIAIVALPLMAGLSSFLQTLTIDTADSTQLIIFTLVLNLVVGIPIGLLAIRIFFVFPAIAIDRTGMGFGGSIKLTRRNTWRIMFVFLLGWILPYTILSWGASLLIFTPFVLKLWIGSIALGFLAMLLQQFVIYIGIALGVSALSIIYKKLVDNVPTQSEPAGPSTA